MELTCKFKALTVDETGIIEGHAAVFGNLDQVGDIIVRGAFTKTLADNPEFPILWGHQEIIGKTLTIREDAKGLFVRAQINLEVQRGREAYALLKQGASKGMSIGYNVVRADTDSDGRRLLREIRLFEVTLTPFPANPDAKVVSVKEHQDRPEDAFLQVLRGASERIISALK
jgi:HK97 family phage prohead protease